MSNNDSAARFLNYPTPIAREAPYTAPPPAKNPVIKGAPLNYLGSL
jgi:hypothetical protein